VIDPCGQAGASVEAVWDAQRAERARASFLAAGVPYAAQAWPPVQAQLERYAGELRAERKATCVATHVRREQTERVFALAVLCLDRRERHLDALVTELERADVQIVERGAEAAAGLPRVDRCRDREALTLGVQPPDDAVTAAKVVRVQTQLATARAQRLSGQPAKARALVQSLLKESEPIAYEPLRAELLAELGALQRDDGSSEGVQQAEQTLLDAVDLADRTRYDELASDLWVDLTMLAREHHGDLALGHQWARRAVATSWRLNDGGRQRSVALSWLGELHFKEDEYAEAERLHREAIALGQKHGATGFELANRLQRLANTLQRMDGRAAEARQLYERAIAAYDAELGVGHPLVAPVLYNYGLLLQRNGATEEARRALGRAISLWTAIDGPSLVDVADAHRMLGNLELEAGRLAAAAEHARRCDEIYRAKLTDPDSPRHARLRTLTGRIALRQGRHAEALAALEGALAQTTRISSSSPLILGSLQSHVAEALAMLGRHDKALQTIGEAEKTLAGMKDVPDAFAAMPPRVRGLALLGKGDARGAAAQLERALSLMQQEPADSLERADAQWALARSLRLAGGAAVGRAEELARQALATYQTRADTLGDSGARTRDAITRWLR
jgi:eukaryotic-like serine/threonine-protein kinase